MIAKPYLAAAINFPGSPDLQANLNAGADLVATAARRGASLIGLPENLPQICESQAEAAAAVPTSYPIAEAWLADQARTHRATVFAGLVAPGEGGRVRNLLVVAGPDGAIVARYAKRHLFDVAFGGADTLQESAAVEPGDDPVVADLGDQGGLGLSICYDVRFPEHYRALVEQGADVLAVPAAFLVHTGKDHWHLLLRARAVENTCYVIAPAQVGRHNPKRQSYGHALIADPWGTVLADAGDRPGVAIAEIDPARLAQVRAQLPCLAHRRS